jgi:hypothetical protein
MVRMFVRHAVDDFDAWKQAYDDFAVERDSMGVVGEAVFQATDDPNDVTVWHDFETLDAGLSFVQSERLKEVMAAAGVAAEPEIWFTTRA